jgi:uncharacterized coiled-coil DUF342 family protein
LRTLQYESWKVSNEEEMEVNQRVEEIKNVKKEIESKLVEHFKEGNKLKIIECNNDLNFLSKRMNTINKTLNKDLF